MRMLQENKYPIGFSLPQIMASKSFCMTLQVFPWKMASISVLTDLVPKVMAEPFECSLLQRHIAYGGRGFVVADIVGVA